VLEEFCLACGLLLVLPHALLPEEAAATLQ
jgi:hypothetical protein